MRRRALSSPSLLRLTAASLRRYSVKGGTTLDIICLSSLTGCCWSLWTIIHVHRCSGPEFFVFFAKFTLPKWTATFCLTWIIRQTLLLQKWLQKFFHAFIVLKHFFLGRAILDSQPVSKTLTASHHPGRDIRAMTWHYEQITLHQVYAIHSRKLETPEDIH